MFLISFTAGLHSTYMACFTTTPGEGELYICAHHYVFSFPC